MVVDGGSEDQTVALARDAGVNVLESICGRGAQQHAGALAARGEVLWFVYADTSPPVHAISEISEALRDRSVVGGNLDSRLTAHPGQRGS